jgi:UPF0042 nucleotide-binding protein
MKDPTSGKLDNIEGRKVIRLMSCGAKYGPAPEDAALVINVRGLPNPFWNESLRPLTGADKPVQDYLLAHESVQKVLATLPATLQAMLPGFISCDYFEEVKVVFVCTGGRHRSRFMAIQAMAIVEQFLVANPHYDCNVILTHRDDHG